MKRATMRRVQTLHAMLYYAANQRVLNNACVGCAPGTTNTAGDVATGADTVCDITLCVRNERW